jgi:hypothetical protein
MDMMKRKTIMQTQMVRMMAPLVTTRRKERRIKRRTRSEARALLSQAAQQLQAMQPLHPEAPKTTSTTKPTAILSSSCREMNQQKISLR